MLYDKPSATKKALPDLAKHPQSLGRREMERKMQTQEALRAPKDAAQAREVYAMGFAPALDAGFDPYAALDMIREDNAKKLDERAEGNIDALFVGKIVSDGKLGRIIEIDGVRVKLVGYFNRTWWAHIGNLSDWSFRAAAEA